MSAVVKGLLALGVLGLASVGGAYAYVEQTANNPTGAEDSPSVLFEVPKGASANKVGRLLADAGLIANARIWQIYNKLHAPPEAKAGKHSLSKAMSMIQIRDAISQNPIADDVPVTFAEGLRIIDADAMLAEKGLIEAGAYSKAAGDPSKFKLPDGFAGKDVEGYLYPETYMIKNGEKLDVASLIQRQIDAFTERFYEAHKEEIAKSNRTLHQLVIMASMLEREEPKPKNRPLVAGILYKRLDKNTPLGVDATSRYNLQDWSDRKKFLAKLRDPADPYNTRLREGLPKGPIGSPSVDSLVAALRPVPSKFWYYLHDKEGNLHPSRNAEEHEKKRKKYNVY